MTSPLCKGEGASPRSGMLFNCAFLRHVCQKAAYRQHREMSMNAQPLAKSASAPADPALPEARPEASAFPATA